MKQKYYLALAAGEWCLLIECLNKLRTRLILEADIPMPWMRCLSRWQKLKSKDSRLLNGGYEYGEVQI